MIERLVRTLQTRGYLLWFDVDMMKGSTVEVLTLVPSLAEHSGLAQINGTCR